MTMTDINYPPSRTLTLGSAHEQTADRVTDLGARIDDLKGDDDATDKALAEARNDQNNAESERDALAWACEEFGEEAEITLEAHTTTRRSRVLDTANRKTMGELGSSQLNDWMLAAAVVEAPWLDGGEDLQERYDYLGALPPALSDWISRELQDLNDLSAGN